MGCGDGNTVHVYQVYMYVLDTSEALGITVRDM